MPWRVNTPLSFAGGRKVRQQTESSPFWITGLPARTWITASVGAARAIMRFVVGETESWRPRSNFCPVTWLETGETLGSWVQWVNVFGVSFCPILNSCNAAKDTLVNFSAACASLPLPTLIFFPPSSFWHSGTLTAFPARGSRRTGKARWAWERWCFLHSLVIHPPSFLYFHSFFFFSHLFLPSLCMFKTTSRMCLKVKKSIQDVSIWVGEYECTKR